MWLVIFEQTIFEFIGDILFFPLWWYTIGLSKVIVACASLIRAGNNQFVPGLWLRYFFVPMYGQTDWQGRIMSVFVRAVNIVVRSVFLAVWCGIVFVLMLLWLIAPVGIVYGLIRS